MIKVVKNVVFIHDLIMSIDFHISEDTLTQRRI